MRSNALVLPLAVVLLTGGANLLVASMAGADGDPTEAAPTEVPEGVTLTGSGLANQASLHGLLVQLDTDTDGPTIRLSNPTGSTIAVAVEASPTFQSGNGGGRMGPFVSSFAPVSQDIEIGPNQTAVWTVELAAESVSPGLMVLNTVNVAPVRGRGGRNTRARPAPQVVREGRVELVPYELPAEPVTDAVEGDGAEAEAAVQVVDVGDNVPVLLPGLEFETWTVGLTVDTGVGPAAKQLVAAR